MEQEIKGTLNRRKMLTLGGAALVASSFPRIVSGQETKRKPVAAAQGLKPRHDQQENRFGPVCVFAKHLQWLSYEEVAEFLVANDLDGIEATVRRGGQIEPENVEKDLPRLVESLKKRDRQVVMITTDINEDSPLARRVLSTAADLGIKYFRMAYYKYKFDRPIIEQLNEHRQTAAQLGEFLAGVDILGLYQNHAGRNFVGASIWDMQRLLEGIPRDRIAAVFDLRHATIEGGHSWPILWHLIKDDVRAIYVKDFRWNELKTESVPLGSGQVNPDFFDLVKREAPLNAPVSLHMEYIDHKDKSRQTDCMEAITRDRKVLKTVLGV